MHLPMGCLAIRIELHRGGTFDRSILEDVSGLQPGSAAQGVTCLSLAVAAPYFGRPRPATNGCRLFDL